MLFRILIDDNLYPYSRQKMSLLMAQIRQPATRIILFAPACGQVVPGPRSTVCPRGDASDGCCPQSGRRLSYPRGVTTSLIAHVVRPLAARGLEAHRSFHGEHQSRAPLLRRVVKPLPVGTRKHANKPRKVHNGQIGSGIVASASARSEWMAVLDAGENGCDESEHFEGRRGLQCRESVCRPCGDYSVSRWR